MKEKTRKIIGWVCSGLALLFLLSGTVPKFLPSYQTEFAKMFPNFAPAWVFGIVLVAAIALYIVPRTRVIGFALSTSYLGGAAALAWMTMGFVNSLVVFVGIALLWIGTALLVPGLACQKTD